MVVAFDWNGTIDARGLCRYIPLQTPIDLQLRLPQTTSYESQRVDEVFDPAYVELSIGFLHNHRLTGGFIRSNSDSVGLEGGVQMRIAHHVCCEKGSC